MTEVSRALREGLTATPKYIPVWYRYDEAGSIYNDKCLTDNKYYYFFPSEMDIIRNKTQDITSCVSGPYSLVDMGSGNSEKTRIIIDAILKKQDDLMYIPVDISEDFLHKTSAALSDHYVDRVHTKPIAGDYDKGIDALRNCPGKKLVVWLGGGFQNQSYSDQCRRVRNLSNVFSGDDRLIVALDITQNSTEVENAYLDPTGVSAPLYLNALWRLNREMGANFDTEKFELRAKFEQDARPDHTSYVILSAVSKENQTVNLPGLTLEVEFRAGEELRMFEGEGVSCKYSTTQLHDLAANGGMVLDTYWTDTDNHVALCCFRKK